MVPLCQRLTRGGGQHPFEILGPGHHGQSFVEPPRSEAAGARTLYSSRRPWIVEQPRARRTRRIRLIHRAADRGAQLHWQGVDDIALFVKWSGGAGPDTALPPLTISPVSGECPGRVGLWPVLQPGGQRLAWLPDLA